MSLRLAACAWTLGILTGLSALSPGQALAQSASEQRRLRAQAQAHQAQQQAQVAQARAQAARLAPPPNSEWLRYPRASGLQLRDVAAIVRITPEVRPDVAVAIVNPGPLRTPVGRLVRNKVVIDGGLRRDVGECRAQQGGRFEASVGAHGWLNQDQLPVIWVRVPREVVVSTSGATQLHVARADTLNISAEGCTDADLEGASGEADVSVSGVGPGVRLYDAGETSVSVAGIGDVVLGVVREGLTVSIAGSGDVVVARADGPTNIAVSGSGDVMVREGRADPLSVMIAGSGDVVHNGSATRMDVAIFGGGNVRVARVDGPVTRRVLGGGNIVVAPPAPPVAPAAPAPVVPPAPPPRS